MYENNQPKKDTNQGQQKSPQSQGFSYIVRKSEKLTTALYMVTDILSDKEPLKWKAREAGVELLSDITVASTASASERMTILRTTLKKIERVVSFIDIAASARMITEMNSGVLKKEYLLLKDSVEAEWQNTHDRSRQMLTERFFDVPSDAVALPSSTQVEEIKPPGSPAQEVVRRFEPTRVAVTEPAQVVASPRPTFTPTQRHVPEKTFVPTSDFAPSHESTSPASIVAPTPQIVRPIAESPIRQNIVVDREIASHSRNDFGRDDRRKIILALLKQKPSVIVGDIAKSIPGVSEKTIQRELLAMVADNVLVKRGERRWSTYSLRTE